MAFASGTQTGTVTPTGCYSTSMYSSVNNASIGSINLTFYSAPAAGTFGVVPSMPTASQVMVAVNGNYATGGSIALTLPGGKKSVVFNNVVCTSPAYTLTGTFACP